MGLRTLWLAATIALGLHPVGVLADDSSQIAYLPPLSGTRAPRSEWSIAHLGSDATRSQHRASKG